MMSSLIWIYNFFPLVFDFFCIIHFILKVFQKFGDIVLSSAILVLYGLRYFHASLHKYKGNMLSARTITLARINFE